MTITATPRRVEYTGDGGTTEFTVPFRFFDVEVYLDGSLQTTGADYFVSQDGVGGEGTVVFNAPVTSGTGVVIVGSTARTQTVDYVNNDDFPAEVHEAALDRLTMIAQEVTELFNRSLRAPITNASVPELDFAANPGTVVYINEYGDPTLEQPGFIGGAVQGEVEAARDAAIAAQAAAELAETNAETAETNAETAQAASELAQAAAETARDGSIAAQAGVEDARDDALLAQAAAEAAADAAAISEANADASETNAAASAAAAAGSALAAAGSASSASTSETNASNSASAASTSATNAANSATAADTAKTAAETAETNAETAQAAAEAAQAAAEAAVGSLHMPVISAGDADKSVVVNNTETGFTLKDTTNQRTFDITVQFDGGSSPITNGVKGYVPVDFSGTIIGWTLVGDQSGSMVVDVWKDTYTNYPPTVADTITASAKPTISTSLKGKSSTLTGWTTSFAAGDVFGFNIDSNSAIKFATLSLHCIKA